MKFEINTQIYGIPTMLHLRIDLLYGKNEEYRNKVLHREFSLDEGGKVDVGVNAFPQIAEALKAEYEGLGIEI